MQIKRGSFRIVFLIGRFAFKTPVPSRSWKGRWHSFLQGWQQNLCELAYSKTGDRWLCPVYFSFFGLVNVMPRCYPFDTTGLYDILKRECGYWYLVENKETSFGTYWEAPGRARKVALDYGNDCIALQQDKMYRLAPLDAKGFDAIPEEEDHV